MVLPVAAEPSLSDVLLISRMVCMPELTCSTDVAVCSLRDLLHACLVSSPASHVVFISLLLPPFGV